jgi:hypothetical protein
VLLGKYAWIFYGVCLVASAWWFHHAFETSKWFQLLAASYFILIWLSKFLDEVIPLPEEEEEPTLK